MMARREQLSYVVNVEGTRDALLVEGSRFIAAYLVKGDETTLFIRRMRLDAYDGSETPDPGDKLFPIIPWRKFVNGLRFLDERLERDGL